MIPKANSHFQILRDYIKHRNRITMSRSDYFFVSPAGIRCGVRDIQRWFINVLKQKILIGLQRLRDYMTCTTLCVSFTCNDGESGVDLYCLS